jgi:galactose mutarotase-like enzyme
VLTVTGGGGIRLATDPADGARITSVWSSGREWLAAGGARSGAAFVQPGSGGWDEVVPTVSACVLADGTVLPDHGDAWSRPWRVLSATPEAVETTVRLDSLPLSLTRRIEATGGGLRMSWRAETESDRGIPLAWCAHPLFAASVGTRVQLDAVPTLTEEYPRRGARRTGLAGHHGEGDRGAGDRGEGDRGAKDRGAVKAFTVAGEHSSASVVHADGAALRLGWDARKLPYLGLYWDSGEFTATPVLAIEPSTARSDSAARVEGELPVVRAGHPLEWSLTLVPHVLRASLPAGPRSREVK